MQRQKDAFAEQVNQPPQFVQQQQQQQFPSSIGNTNFGGFSNNVPININQQQQQQTQQIQQPSSNPGDYDEKAQELVDLHSIAVRNVHLKAKEEEIRTLFQQYGPIVRLTKKKTYCYIEYPNVESCDAAIQGKNGSSFWGRNLIV
jgi:RNA recognition motif-containing protein